MVTRHFHATSLVLVGVLLLLGLSLVLGQKPTLPTHTSLSTTDFPSPTTPITQTKFLYYDYTATYDSFFIDTLETNTKQGIYGTTDRANPYTDFALLNKQLYMIADNKAGILNLVSHFFYGINTESIPFTVSPSQTKAIYATFLKTATKTKNSNQTTQLNIVETNPNKETLIPIATQLIANLTPLCWSSDEKNVILTSPTALYMLSLEKKTISPIKFSSTVNVYAKVYCNSQADMLYFDTPNGFYEQKFIATQPKKVNVPQTTVPYVFSSTNTSNNALTTDQNSLEMIDLSNGNQKKLYTATVSATLQPYFWKGDTVLFTEQSNKPVNGIYYFVGRTLNLHTQVMTTFAKHEASTLDALGSIIPIGWIQE